MKPRGCSNSSTRNTILTMSEGEKIRKTRKSASKKVNRRSDVGGQKKTINSNNEIETRPTANSKLLTETMEVHHHPEIEKKGLKEYLLEGLMIFLAVTMGFFAESYRERGSERTKEREYIINIKKDLATDTLNLNIWIPSLYRRVLSFDTLISCLEIPGPVKNGARMYYLARLSTRNGIFEPSDNTILELKSSGNLRLIQNIEIVNGMMDFERSLGQYTNLLDIEGKENVLSYPLLGQLFDAKVFDKMVIVKNKELTEKEYAAGSTNNTLVPPGNPQLLSYDKEKINLLIYYLHQRKSSFLGEIRRLSAQKALVEKLIKMINQEYKLQ
ncbi:MAG: hypothetical protein JWR02_2563 [Mucilaginibacter sp.]|nr:hypothetical protein [Mucilaginibacter sp.]